MLVQTLSVFPSFIYSDTFPEFKGGCRWMLDIFVLPAGTQVHMYQCTYARMEE
jgi:hypothetical protein